MKRTSLVVALVAAALMCGVVGAQRGQAVPAPTGTGLIAGQVVAVGSGEGVAGIQVILTERGGNFQWRVNADSKGRFYFGQLPARTFAIQTVTVDVGSTVASTAGGFGRFVTLAEGERATDLRIGILRYASVSGTVRDDAGDAMVGMTVVAFQRTFTGGRIQYPARARARTDDRGDYLLPVLPGEYLICACAVDPLPLDGGVLSLLAAQPLSLVAAAGRAATLGEASVQFDDTLHTFAPTFYPAATMPSQAERVTLNSGESKTSVNIDVLPVRAARVSGRVVGASGPVLASSIRLRPVDEAGLVVIPDIQPMLTQADGRFDFTGIPAGEYTLQVSHVRRMGTDGPSGTALGLFGARGNDPTVAAPEAPVVPGAPLEWGQAHISVGGRDITDLLLMVQPAVSISGRIEFAGVSAAPATDRLTRMNVGIESASRAPGEPDFSAAPARVTADATFTIVGGVSPGQYVFRTSGTAPWSTLRSITVAGRDVTDLPVEVDSAGLRDVVLTLDDSAASSLPGRLVGGWALNGPDAFLAAAFPTDRRLWVNPTAASRRFRSASVDQKGAFNLIGLPEGEYYLVPVPDQVGLVWQDAGNLDRLARAAMQVRISPGVNQPVEVRR